MPEIPQRAPSSESSTRWKNILIAGLALGWGATAAVLISRKPPGTGARARLDPGPEAPLSPLSPPVDSLAPVRDVLAAMRSAEGLRGAAIGFVLLGSDGECLISEGGETAMIPASALKTVTTATALEQLGEDFRFQTEVRAPVKPDEARVLDGDLVLRGGGDPTLSTGALEALAAEIRATGLTRITGRVVGDARVLPERIASDYWNWGDVGNGYGSGVAGLNVDHNRFAALFAPGAAEGDPAEFLGAGEDLSGLQWVNRVTTGPPGSGDNVVLYGGPHATTLFLSGTVPAGIERFTVAGALPDPPGHAARVFLRALYDVGIEVDGGSDVLAATDSSAPPPEVLATHASVPLREIVRHLHEVSDNHEAEGLFRLLAHRHGMPGEDVVRAHWAARGLAFEGLRMEDGSGLARADFIRPCDLARLLDLVRHGAQGDVFRQSLTAHFGTRVRWKGGAMSGVRSWAGYARDEAGNANNERVFVLIVNHFDADARVAAWRDRLVQSLLDPPPPPDHDG